jgi:hypothetical protein
MLVKLSAWFFIPSLFMVILSFSSLAMGMVALALVGILLNLVFGKPLKITKLYIYLIVISAISILSSFLLFDQNLNFKHLSLAALFVVGVGAPFFLRVFTEPFLSKENSYRIIFLYLILLLIGILGSIIPLRIGNYALASHPVFPFSEPSHFALIYGPISCMALAVSGPKMRALICLMTFGLSLSLPNTTLLLFALLISLINFSLLVVLFILVILVFMLFVFVSSDLLLYFTGRLTGENAENLSRLVYIQGWENMFSALSSTFGIGIGFQNFGNEPSGDASFALSLLTESGLNRSDGGFLLAKLGGEFGLIGVFAVFFLSITSISAGYILRKKILSDSFNRDLSNPLPLCVVYTMLIELFIRGVGYFSPTLFLALFSLPCVIGILKKKY